MDKIAEVKQTIKDNWKVIKASIPEHMNAARLVAIAVVAIEGNDNLMRCSASSIVRSVCKAAQVGIIPDDGTQRAYLVPYKGECTYMVGYRGLLELAYQSGVVDSVDSQVVWDGDEIDIRLGTEQRITHVPAMEHGEMRAVYSVVRLVGRPTPIIEVMVESEIRRVRRAASNTSPAWGTWPEEMARKSVIKRGLKRVPLDPTMRLAIALEDTGRGVAVEEVMQRTPDGWAAIGAAAKSPAPADIVEEPIPSEETDEAAR